MAKFAGGAAALAGAATFIKSATQETEALAKGTLALSRTTGMDTKTASEWVTVLKSRGIEVNAFQRGMVTLSKQMEAASTGSKKSVSAFKELGVSMADIRKGNTQQVLMQAADGLSKIENPAKRAALAQQLFARQGQALAPILFKGSQAIQDQLNMADRYGATLSDKSTKGVADLIARQREMGIAFEGTKIQLGQALLPALLAVSQALVSVTQVIQPLVANGTAMKIMLGLLTAAFIAYKVAVIASTVASLGLNAAMLPEIAIALAIVAGIAALIAIGVLLYKHWDDLAKLAGTVWAAIKTAAQTVFNWFKANWPLLLGILAGPFGLAAALIATHWSTIRNTVTNALAVIRSAVTSAFAAVVAAVSGAMTTMVAAIRGAVSGAVSAAQAIATGVRNVFAGAAAWLVSAGHNIVAGLVNGIHGALSLATGAVHGVESSVKGVFAGAGGWLYSAGRSIVQGLVSGIESMIGSVVGAVEKLSSLAEKAFKLANKIPHSPSGLYQDYGRDLAAGLALGITKNAGLVGRALAGLPAGAPTGMAATPAAAAVGPSGGVTVRVFIGDTELRGLVHTEIVQANTGLARTLLAGGRL